MTTMTVSEKGQVTLPAELRRRYGLSGGSLVEIEARDDGLFLRRVRSVAELAGILADRAKPGATFEDERRSAQRAMVEEAVRGD